MKKRASDKLSDTVYITITFFAQYYEQEQNRRDAYSSVSTTGTSILRISCMHDKECVLFGDNMLICF